MDDPFAADELALPTLSSFRALVDGKPVTENAAEFEWSKSIVNGFAVSFGGGYVHQSESGGASGFENLEITPIVELARNEDHEFIATAAFRWEIGGTGSGGIGESRSSYTPAFLFGKGFGDLPDSMALLRPLAVTGRVGYVIPGRPDEPHTLEWGGAVEYSLAYLTQNVRDVGLGPFWSHVTPVVEFSLSSPLDRNDGTTTGTINPGLLWSGQYMQIGIEAIVPANGRTGDNVGVVAQLHFYIDDIFPHSLGTPIFGGNH